ncbi:MAG: NAD-dependent epimerase/dehydratase family protein [Phycisphaerae bacterium]|nr:NAD-dependent epimerase/dehydratase family protein [Gemmatimonadaceae bacterium]
MTSRRDFLKGAGAIAGGVVLSGGKLHGMPPTAASRLSTPDALGIFAAESHAAPLNILVLGGTGFIGPHLVRRLVERGHTVSIFTRGRREAELPASVQRLVGDRDAKDASGQLAGNYESLKGKKWDAVFDDSATNPNWVRQSTALLKDATPLYLFVSSTGVFYPYRTTNIDETTKVRMSMTEEAADQFGVNKANCEQIVRDAFGKGAIIVRPTYIVGPLDTSDRFTYWPVRLARGGDVLAPGKNTDSAQFVDVRDLAAFMIKVVEDKRGDTYNVAGPRERLTFAKFIDEAKKAVGPDAKITWIDDYPFLTQQKLEFACPWGLPEGNELGQMSIDNRRAVAAGLTFRPIGETVKDTLAWWNTLPADRREKNRFVLKPEREAEILAAWRARGK